MLILEPALCVVLVLAAVTPKFLKERKCSRAVHTCSFPLAVREHDLPGGLTVQWRIAVIKSAFVGLSPVP